MSELTSPSNAPSSTLTDSSTIEFDNLTDGSAKIFGMENFGNTCYCNSILQCLYYSKPFRENILNFPPHKPRQARLEVNGIVPHPFTVDPNAATLNTSIQPEYAATPNPNSVGSGIGRKMSIFGKKDDKNNNNSNGQANGQANGNANAGGMASYLEAISHNPSTDSTGFPLVKPSPMYQGLDGLTLGARFPGQNLPVVGFTDDPFATPEQRKRSALVKGPIINMDLSFAKEYNMEESLFTGIKDIFDSMAESNSRTGVVSPAKLIKIFREQNEMFNTSMHQDAHEFLNFMLNGVIKEVQRQANILENSPSDEEAAPLAAPNTSYY